jgi:hypothetical protein
MSACCLFGVMIATQGCSSDATDKKDDSQMRAAMGKKQIDLNDVPPDQRARVQAYMNMSKSGPPPGNSVGAAPAPKP